MRILHVIPSMDPKSGGLCQAVRNIIKYTTSDKIVHEVFCLDDPNIDYCVKDDFRKYTLGKGITPWNYSFRLSKWLQNHLGSYEHVIVHGLWQYQSYAIHRAWKKYKHVEGKLHVMPHGMLDPYFQRAKDRRIKAFRNLIFWEVIERRLLNNADSILFTCEIERRLAHLPFRKFSPKEERIVGLGVDQPPEYNESMVAHFSKLCPEAVYGKYILFLSRINRKKGIDMLVESYMKLKTSGVKLPQLVIVGPGLETAYGQSMQIMAAKEKDIIFGGMLTGDAKWGAFYGCEVFALPSHQENFGIAVVEALACKKAVLISKQINIYQEIEQGKAGIVENDTLEGVESMLQRWVNLDVVEREGYNQNAGLTYEKYFAPITAAAAFLQVIC